MNKDCISGFLRFALSHATAAADVKALRQRGSQDGRGSTTDALAKAVAKERNVRAALIGWKPDSNIEAQTKLLYVAHYLFSMRTSLDTQEMLAMMNSIAHIQKKARPSVSSAQEGCCEVDEVRSLWPLT
jgi:hypothetical protein